MFKKKIALISFMLAFVLIIPILFTACKPAPAAYSIGYKYTYNGETYSFNATDDDYFEFNIEYRDNITFSASDFELLEYHDDEYVKTITASDFTFLVHDRSDPFDVYIEPVYMVPGNYEIVFFYSYSKDNIFQNFINLYIQPKALTQSDVQCDLAAGYEYTVELPAFDITYNGTTLIENVDYEIANYNDENNQRFITVQFIGCYTGTVVYSYEFYA